jgi:hypothetical protein
MKLKNYEVITLLTGLKAFIRESGGNADELFGSNIDKVQQNLAVDELDKLTSNPGEFTGYMQSLYKRIASEFTPYE